MQKAPKALYYKIKHKYIIEEIMKRLAILLSLIIALPLFAFHSDPFPMGVYSYLQNSKEYYIKNKHDIIAAMKDLGYNINVIEIQNSDPNPSELLTLLDEAGIDAILTDKCWVNDPKDSRHYGLVALSTSNYHRFEAEFTSEKAVKPGDNTDHKFWYGNSDTIPRTGRVVKDEKASYSHAWHLNQNNDRAGWAYTDINYRWKDLRNLTIKPYFELRFHNRHIDAKVDTDSLYITYRLKLENIDPRLKESENLLSIEIYGHEGRDHFGKKMTTVKEGLSQAKDRRHFTLADYKALGNPKGYFDLEYAISYNDLRDAGIMSDDLDDNPDTSPHWWWFALRHFAPGLYWHGNSDLTLDYIDFEDQIHRDLRLNPKEYKERINDRIRELIDIPGGHIVRYIYTMDEPQQGNLSALNMLREYVDDSLPPLATATYDIHSRKFRMAKDQYWYYPQMVRDICQQPVMMPDAYPIVPATRYNPKDGRNFLQNMFDERLLTPYQSAKEYVLESPQREFIPIPQSFGDWNGRQWSSWMLPPSATQKALLFLPLCYAPDGLVFYQLLGTGDGDRGGSVAPIYMEGEGIAKFDKLYDLLKEHNPRVLKTGEMLLDWHWLGSSTFSIGKDKNIPAPIKYLKLKNDRKGDYAGYIQAGFYENEEGEKLMVLVNRRTDKYLPSKAHPTPATLPMAEYDEHYWEYPPQKLYFTFYVNANNPRLMNMESGEIYEPHKRKLELDIPAGEMLVLKIMQD